MRRFFSIVVCKLLSLVGRLLGKGSSLPGRVALKLCPDILTRLTLPPLVAAVTGSNGKTSTVEMIHHILTAEGRSVLHNREGANQTDGIVTMLIRACTLRGRVKADVVLLESDERYARFTFKQLRPTHLTVLNLLRDQLTRNGHPEHIFDLVGQALSPATRLILNGDDPLTALYGQECDETVYFGAQDGVFSAFAAGSPAYDDGAFCPACKHPFDYEFRHYAHIGGYSCAHCRHRRPVLHHAVTAFQNGAVTLNGLYTVPLSLGAPWEIHNVAAAFSTAVTLGVPPESAAAALCGFASRAGRVKTFSIGSRPCTLLTAKHENAQSYNLSLQYLRSGPDSDLLIYVNAISRKYFTGETSWLWDIDFESLRDFGGTVYLAGRYARDLAHRFSFVSPPKLTVVESGLRDALRQGDRPLCILTCFSDRDGLLRLLEGGAA